MPAQLHSQTNLSHLNDDFDDSQTFFNWKSHHETEGWSSFCKKADINTTSQGHFYIEPMTTGWYGDFHRGPFFFKEVAGDFTAITKVKVTGLKSESPMKGYSLAGLMVRVPRPANEPKDKKGLENWMFLSTGSADKKGQPQFESKNTVDGKSKLKIFSAKSGWIQIAISRVGDTFYQFYKYENGDWQLLRVEDRPNMPETVQVGLLAYTDFWPLFRYFIFKNRKKFNEAKVNGSPDLIARFAYIKFQRPGNAKALKYKTGFYNTALDKNISLILKLEE